SQNMFSPGGATITIAPPGLENSSTLSQGFTPGYRRPPLRGGRPEMPHSFCQRLKGFSFRWDQVVGAWRTAYRVDPPPRVRIAPLRMALNLRSLARRRSSQGFS